MNALPLTGRIGITGFAISFIGTLPFGVLNVLAFFIALSESFSDAMLFSLGVVLVELIYVSLTLFGANRFRLNAVAANRVRVIMLIVILVVTYSSLHDALSGRPLQPVLQKGIPRFFLGLGLSAVNALQIPFWMGWNALLIEKKRLHMTRAGIIRYLSGIGAGTLAGLLVFILAAVYAGKNATAHIREIKLFIALLLCATALFMAYKLLFSNRKQRSTRIESRRLSS